MLFYLHINCWCSPWCRQNTGEIYGITILFVVSLLFCQTPGPGVERIFVAFNLSFGLGMVKSKLKFQVIQINHPAVACPTLQDLLLRLKAQKLPHFRLERHMFQLMHFEVLGCRASSPVAQRGVVMADVCWCLRNAMMPTRTLGMGAVAGKPQTPQDVWSDIFRYAEESLRKRGGFCFLVIFGVALEL